MMGVRRLDGIARNLHGVLCVCRLPSTQESVKTKHFATADHTSLNGRTVTQGDSNGDETINGEVDLLDRLARLEKPVALFQ